MEMLHLRYFVAVAEELNFSAAARRLQMATSPLSQRIRDLERELGSRLFDRDTHHVALTAAGETLLPIARGILDEVNAIPWKLREAAGTQRDTLQIGMPPGVHPDLRARIGELADRVQDRIDLQRWPGSHAALIDAVRAGELALTVAWLPVPDPALDFVPVLSERVGAVVSAAQFAGRDSVGLAELADFAYVTVTEGGYSQLNTLHRELERRGIRKSIPLAGSDFSGVSEIVSAGDTFALSMLNNSAMHAYRVADTTVLPFTDFAPHLETALVWRADRAGDGALKDLLSAIRETFSEPLER
ncbi:LysR family transcriptional regulator [Pseudonocardiaceae bacterium YIM PH 21723]|nr:LysR family transcriptional regulator [Pseudonocardiaceae bacterium YIM PH 21723]